MQAEQERVARSMDAYMQLTARMTLCSDLAGLKLLGKEITPQLKASMLPEDVANLRERYLERERELSGKLV
jgi:hypothetical protein